MTLLQSHLNQSDDTSPESNDHEGPRSDAGRPSRTYLGLTLDQFQLEALEAIDREQDVIVAAPTGAGKTLIAHYAIERALAAGKRVVYTAPIKALSNQKFRDLSEQHPGQVGISTGDVSINAGAPIVIMTTEIFRNTIFDDPRRMAEIGWVIFDEVHYLDDRERGTVWEESLIFAPRSIRILALSATVSNLDEFAAWIREARNSDVRVVLETHRPVPLSVYVASTEGGIKPLKQIRGLRVSPRAFRNKSRRREGDVRGYFERAQRRLVQDLAQHDRLPVLFFLFSRAACERLAQNCGDLDFMPNPEAARAAEEEFSRLAAAFELDPADPEVSELRRLVARGIAYHHAGILPALKEVIERLFTDGHLRLLCATETFALGVNMPARSVAFEGIKRWDGTARVPLKTREYQQMAGRAGRRGIDERGYVYLTYDPFGNDTGLFEALVHGRVEPVESQFNLSYGTLLNLYSRLGDALYEACERSFANFKARRAVREAEARGEKPRGRKGGGGRRGRKREQDPLRWAPGSYRYADIVKQVRLRMGVLEELGYIDREGEITARGQFAMQIFGHELELTELIWAGVLDGLKPAQIAVVATAIVFESRPHVGYGGADPKTILGKHTFRLAQQTVGDLIRLEEQRGVRPPGKLLDWNLSGVASAWVEGAEFAELRRYTDASDGDIVRSLRQAIQVLRLATRPLRSLRRGDLVRRVKDAQKLLKRGLVDAEWQLRRGAELSELPVGASDDDELEGPEVAPAPGEGPQPLADLLPLRPVAGEAPESEPAALDGDPVVFEEPEADEDEDTGDPDDGRPEA